MNHRSSLSRPSVDPAGANFGLNCHFHREIAAAPVIGNLLPRRTRRTQTSINVYWTSRTSWLAGPIVDVIFEQEETTNHAGPVPATRNNTSESVGLIPLTAGLKHQLQLGNVSHQSLSLVVRAARTRTTIRHCSESALYITNELKTRITTPAKAPNKSTPISSSLSMTPPHTSRIWYEMRRLQSVSMAFCGGGALISIKPGKITSVKCRARG